MLTSHSSYSRLKYLTLILNKNKKPLKAYKLHYINNTVEFPQLHTKELQPILDNDFLKHIFHSDNFVYNIIKRFHSIGPPIDIRDLF